MSIILKKLPIILFVMYVLGATFGNALEVPDLKARITDQVGILSNSAKNDLEQKIYQHEKKTSVQIAVLIIPSLEGESLEDFSLKVAEKAKIGQKGKDNGVLFLMAIQDRLMRIEVGYGLEGQIPDARTRRIQEGAKQYFRSGSFEAGVAFIVNKLILYSDPETKPEQKSTDNALNDKRALIYLILFLLILFVLIPFTGFIILPLIYKSGNAMLGAPFGIIGIIVFGIALIVFKLFLRSVLGRSLRDQFFSGPRMGRRSGFGGWGGFGGGGFGGGGFGGGGFGGFGGGGGGFGGGGSSSKW